MSESKRMYEMWERRGKAKNSTKPYRRHIFEYIITWGLQCQVGKCLMPNTVGDQGELILNENGVKNFGNLQQSII